MTTAADRPYFDSVEVKVRLDTLDSIYGTLASPTTVGEDVARVIKQFYGTKVGVKIVSIEVQYKPCDRCHQRVDSVEMREDCSICGPTLLCDSCHEAHAPERNEA